MDSFAPAVVYGDMNFDDIEDVALVVEQNEADFELTPARALVIGYGTGYGNYELAAFNDNIVLRADEGGILGDPYNGIYFDDQGILTVSEYGGSNWRWSNNYRFAYLVDEWYFIGYNKITTYLHDESEYFETDFDMIHGKILNHYFDESGNLISDEDYTDSRELFPLDHFSRWYQVGDYRGYEDRYYDNNLGYELSFPKSWQDYYSIQERDYGIDVYFTGNSSPSWEIDEETFEANGLYLFSVGTENTMKEAGDSIDDVRWLGTAHGNTYYYFTSTDCSTCILSMAVELDIDEDKRELMISDYNRLVLMMADLDLLLYSFISDDEVHDYELDYEFDPLY
ncbi:hypothetical protein G9U52_23910 [Paenibacillus sp. S3N08]|uniref:Uncharacterized protein n=1 Tax=Paenibacillus agricola TaxID=2716264 RepID=A0ABX0JCA5_9BACL|nr:hypothetical protein [Paenibacillus agricola]